MITNIPTDLLRTLIAVVEMRSFTKAARQLGVTQPAVSAQIKRLQCLLGNDLLDKSAPGVALTATGERVVAYARRLLSINDQILNLAIPQVGPRLLRLGVPTDCVTADLVEALSALMPSSPEIRFELRSGGDGWLADAWRRGELDVLVEYSVADPGAEAHDGWVEELAWIRGPGTSLDPHKPVPLVTDNEDSLLRRVASETLAQVGRSIDLVFTANDTTGLAAAVAAGLGVAAMPRRRVPDSICVWDAAPLPRLAPVWCAIRLREGGDLAQQERLADAVGRVLKRVRSYPASDRAVANS